MPDESGEWAVLAAEESRVGRTEDDWQFDNNET